jgi:pyridoxine 5-phosphate synthase
VDPVIAQIEAAKEVGAEKIEIHTGEFANARHPARQRELLEEVRSAAKLARELGMGVNAGHGLNYVNIIPFREIEEIEEVSIGHAIIARALFVGMDRAVREMRELVK